MSQILLVVGPFTQYPHYLVNILCLFYFNEDNILEIKERNHNEKDFRHIC